MEDYLTKQNKQKNENKNRNKKLWNYKPRFKHKPTLPIHTFPPTDTSTATKNTQPRFKQHTTTTTKQYTQPTHKNHASTWCKPLLLPQYTNSSSCQPNTHHTLKYKYTHAPSTIIHPSAVRPHSQPIYNTIYYSNQLVKPTQILHTNHIYFSPPNHQFPIPVFTNYTNIRLRTMQITTSSQSKPYTPTQHNHHITLLKKYIINVTKLIP